MNKKTNQLEPGDRLVNTGQVAEVVVSVERQGETFSVIHVDRSFTDGRVVRTWFYAGNRAEHEVES